MEACIMDLNTLKAALREGLNAIPLLDVHTHLDAAHLTGRGLHDILLYHMLVSDLASAGCPTRARLSEDPSDAEAEARLVEALPYLKYVQNTSIFWGARIILRDLYGWTEPITAGNWRLLDARIRAHANNPTWAREILKRAGVKRASTELWRRCDGSADDIFQYSLEWAFFTRAQWGVNDIPLYELERAWNQPEPGAPLPVTLGERAPLERAIHTLEEVHAAIRHYVERIPYDQIISTAQHISTDINYRLVSEAEMAVALSHRAQAAPPDRDVYASYILEAFLSELEAHGDQIVYHFSFGAEPLPYETGSKLRQETIFELAAIISRHPRLRFQALLSSEHANQSLCTLARELPNLSLAGYWWHNFFPGIMRKVINDRLDMLAANKQVGFFSDAYCLEWTYAKAVLTRAQWTEVLAQKIEQGQYTLDEALSIARQIFYETPQTLLGMRPLNVES
jgi:glucuronate isomerase